MEAIPSGEVFPNVELVVGEPPKLTEEEHRYCTYYPGFKPECTHGVQAAGGFYSEDYLKDLKALSHQIISFIDQHVELKVTTWSNNARIERKYLHVAEVNDFKTWVEELRELTK